MIHDHNPPTLSDVVAIIQSHPAATSKYETCRAIETASGWFGRTPSTTPANPAWICSQFRHLPRARIGVSKKSVANVKSLVLLAIRLARGEGMTRYLSPLSEDWIPVWQAMTPRERLNLSRWCRRASNFGLKPQNVDDDFSRSCLEWLIEEGVLKAPRERHKTACRAWNRLAQRLLAHHLKRVTLPIHRVMVPGDHTKASPRLLAEFEEFLKVQELGDLFDLRAPREPLRDDTIRNYRKAFRIYLAGLNSAGVDTSQIETLAEALRIDHANAALRKIFNWRGDPERKARSTAAGIAGMLVTIARRWVQNYPPDDLKTLKKLTNKLRVRRNGVGLIHRERLAPLRHEKNLAKLFRAGLDTCRELRDLQHPTKSDAQLYERALAPAILTFCPIRIRTLCLLRTDRHLSWSEPSMNGNLVLELADDDMKEGMPASLPLPPEIADLVRVYIERFRPLIAPEGNPFLFPARSSDQPKCRRLLAKQIQSFFWVNTGFMVSPHLFRHVVHLVVLKILPGAFGMIADILTHSAIQTAYENYSYFSTPMSLKVYQNMVLEAMKEGQTPSKEADVAMEYGGREKEGNIT